jgi:hypothetical protein
MAAEKIMTRPSFPAGRVVIISPIVPASVAYEQVPVIR